MLLLPILPTPQLVVIGGEFCIQFFGDDYALIQEIIKENRYFITAFSKVIEHVENALLRLLEPQICLLPDRGSPRDHIRLQWVFTELLKRKSQEGLYIGNQHYLDKMLHKISRLMWVMTGELLMRFSQSRSGEFLCAHTIPNYLSFLERSWLRSYHWSCPSRKTGDQVAYGGLIPMAPFGDVFSSEAFMQRLKKVSRPYETHRESRMVHERGAFKLVQIRYQKPLVWGKLKPLKEQYPGTLFDFYASTVCQLMYQQDQRVLRRIELLRRAEYEAGRSAKRVGNQLASTKEGIATVGSGLDYNCDEIFQKIIQFMVTCEEDRVRLVNVRCNKGDVLKPDQAAIIEKKFMAYVQACCSQKKRQKRKLDGGEKPEAKKLTLFDVKKTAPAIPRSAVAEKK